MTVTRSSTLNDDRINFATKLYERFHVQTERSSQLAVVAVAVTWIPMAAFALIAGLPYIRAFLFDFAAQSRILLAIPLLIVAEPPIVRQRFNIAKTFLSNNLVRPEQVSRFKDLFATFERRRKQRLAHLLLVVIVYGSVALFMPDLNHASIPSWCSGTEFPFGLSWAGAYYLFLFLPLLLYLVLRWMWDIVLWTAFLRSVSLMDLRLVPSHPDLMAGLSFLETILRFYLPFAYSIGIIVAGGVANQVLRFHKSINSFKSIELAAVSFVVIMCAGPLGTFYYAMLAAHRRGTFEYGRFATKLGHEFEAKWIDAPSGPDLSTLEVPDFSATTDLYSIAANTRQLKMIPCGVKSVMRLVVATLLPGVPVAISVIPFAVVIDKLVKLLI
jgi:hypothetical protein